MSATIKPLIETQALSKLLLQSSSSHGGVKLLHSVYMPGKVDQALKSFESCHIKGAKLFNADVIRDHDSPYPFMLPSKDQFISHMKALKIRKTDKIVCYDDRGVFISPRTWWMLRVMGAKDVSVLNGGLPKWLEEKQAVQVGPGEEEAKGDDEDGDYDYELDQQMYVKYEEINTFVNSLSQESKKDTSRNLIEVRPGVEDEKKHIPGSKFLPFPKFQNNAQAGYSMMKNETEIKEIFTAAGVNAGQDKNIFTCGGAITACIDALAFQSAFYKEGGKFAVYDGSFSEWSSKSK